MRVEEKNRWYSEEMDVFLIGDSIHATSPNLAQGAGKNFFFYDNV